MNKKKTFKIVVIGSGLPSLNFIDEFLKKNKNIDVISPNFNYELEKSNVLNKHLFKLFPTPGIKKNINKVKKKFIKESELLNYFYINRK